jgi:flagellar biosynthesis protein FliP
MIHSPRSLHVLALGIALALAMLPLGAYAQQIPGIISQPLDDGGQQWSIQLQTLLLLTSLAFLPAALLMMTSFTRIIIVLSLLRTAMGTQTTPPNQVLLGLTLFLTFFVMSPVIGIAYETAWVPLLRKRSTSRSSCCWPRSPSASSCWPRHASPTWQLFARLARSSRSHAGPGRRTSCVSAVIRPSSPAS